MTLKNFNIIQFSILRVIDSGQFFEEPKYYEIYSLLRQAIQNTEAKVF